MSLERLHRTIKYNYLNGKKVKRLDKTIYALRKFVNDKQFERVIYLSKGKISSKQATLSNRRNVSKTMELEVFEDNDDWLVKSSTVFGEFYSVSEKSYCSLECTLLCKLCNKSFHNYECSCIDNCTRSNMCKHIHLVYRFISSKNKDGISESNSQTLNNNKSNHLIIEEESPDVELKWHVNNLKWKTKDNSYFQKKKNRLLTPLDACSEMPLKKQQHAIKIIQEATIKLQALNTDNSLVENNMKSISKDL